MDQNKNEKKKKLNKASKACYWGLETTFQLTVMIILFPLVRRNQTKRKPHKNTIYLNVTHVFIKETSLSIST